MRWHDVRRVFILGGVLLAVTLIAAPVSANMVLPLMFVHVWPGLLALFPVALVEGAVAGRTVLSHTGLSEMDIYLSVFLANLASFLIGVPLALTLPELLPFPNWPGGDAPALDAFLWAFKGESMGPWMDGIAWTVTVLILFLMSLVVETWVFARMTSLPAQLTRRAMLRANGASYGFLYALGLVFVLNFAGG